MYNDIKEKLLKSRELIPVVVIKDEKDALPLSQAITEAKGQFIEITLRTKAALAAIRNIKSENPHIIIGAGTVLNISDAKEAIKAGADFLVSPGLDEKVVQYATTQNIFMIPGVISPTEVQHAMALGLEILKFFPAEYAGGAGMIKAMGAVYPRIKFMPTGGIDQQNIQEYIALPNICCIGASWVCPQADIQSSQFNAITEKLKQANQLF